MKSLEYLILLSVLIFSFQEISGQNFSIQLKNADQTTYSYLSYSRQVVLYNSNYSQAPGGSNTDTKSVYISIDRPKPNADFSGNPRSGAAPLSVSFTDKSTGKITSWFWDFGDSTNSSAQNPTHTYSNPGIYTIELTVTGPGGSSTKTRRNYINVSYSAPVADFSGSPTSGTAPFNVIFIDASSGNISSWSWDFGDDSSSTAQNPAHIYSNPGTYTVKLTVTGPGGSNTKTRLNYINVGYPAPVADFSGSPTSGTAPLNVTFADASSGNISSWSWDFGDDSNSTTQNPSHSYSNPGTYTVKLTVTGPGGSNTKTRLNYINVGYPAPVADFSGSPTSGTAPLNVTFADASSGNISSWSWDFGDGSNSTAKNPSHTYSNPGTYTIKLTVTGPGGSNTKTRSNYIKVDYPTPVADFSGDPTSGTAPLNVTFTDASSGNITSWSWDFGDDSSSTTQNPSHSYSDPGIYTVKLTVTGPGGSNTKTRSNYINAAYSPPVADFSGSPTSGTAPLSVSFTDLSTGNISNWLWDFGDDSSSIAQNPTHIYSNPGLYTIKLTITGAGGSDSKDSSDYISVDKPSLEISVTLKEVSKEADSLETFIKSNISWSVSTNTYWLYVNPLSGFGNSNLKIYYDANQSASVRTALILVSGSSLSDTIKLEQQGVVTGINDLEYANGNIHKYYLTNNYPNPFNPQTSIEFGIPEESTNTLMIFDINGRLVKTVLQNETLQRGQFRYKFNAENLPTGVYILVFTSSSLVSNKTFKGVEKMILLK